jgi:leucyl aminopeptidase
MRWTKNEFQGVGMQLIIPLFEGITKAPNNSLNGLSRIQRSLVKAAIISDDFEGKKRQRLSVWTTDCRVLLVGLGKKDEISHKQIRNTGARIIGVLSKKKGTDVTVRFTSGMSIDNMLNFAEGMMLRDYRFDLHQKIDEDECLEPWDIEFQASERYQEKLEKGLKDLESIVGGVHLARDLGNEPANVLYPMEFARRAIEWASNKENVRVEVYDWDKLQELKMGGLINVGKGSDRKPCMVLFTLNPDADRDVQRPCIVGKGITFDTGGISIKPTSGMWDMKYDMCGAATVFGLMESLWASGYNRRVNGITCLAENMPGSGAYRPGDIISTYSGKTVEIYSTDAEGRNVLADGLWKAGEFDPEYIIDLATLTGAVVVALGNQITGMWSNSNSLQLKLKKAGANFPSIESQNNLLKSINLLAQDGLKQLDEIKKLKKENEK